MEARVKKHQSAKSALRDKLSLILFDNEV